MMPFRLIRTALRTRFLLVLLGLLAGPATAIDLHPGDIVALRSTSAGQPYELVRIDFESGSIEPFHATASRYRAERIIVLSGGEIALVVGRSGSATVSKVIVVDPATGGEEVFETEWYLYGGIAALSDGDIALTGLAYDPSPAPDEWTPARYGIFRLARETREFTEISHSGGIPPVEVLFADACDDLFTLSYSQVGWDGVTRVALASGAQVIKPIPPAVKRGSTGSVASTLTSEGEALIVEPRSVTSTDEYRLQRLDPRSGLSEVIAQLPGNFYYKAPGVGANGEIYLFAYATFGSNRVMMQVDPETGALTMPPIDMDELGFVVAMTDVPATDPGHSELRSFLERRRCQFDRWRLLIEHLRGFPLNPFREGPRR